MKNSHRATITFLLAILLLTTQTGCSIGTSYAPTNTIPIKVYRVFGEFDSQNNVDGNDGCQLDTVEIGAIIDSLAANSPSFYGTSSSVSWDGSITNMIDPELNTRDTPITSLFLRIISTGNTYHDPSAINIYFSGNYYIDSPSIYNLYGATLDPLGSLASLSGVPALIVINDGDGQSTSGGDLDLHRYQLTLEHEVGHYLGRFNKPHNINQFDPSANATRTYGSGSTARTFPDDGGEHIDSTTTTVIHLMMDGNDIPSGGYPATMPGVEYPMYTDTVQGAEKGAVSRKLSIPGGYNDWRR